MKSNIYRIFAVALLAGYGVAELGGYELPGRVAKGTIAPGSRNASGFRSFSYWNGGK